MLDQDVFQLGQFLLLPDPSAGVVWFDEAKQLDVLLFNGLIKGFKVNLESMISGQQVKLIAVPLLLLGS